MRKHRQKDSFILMQNAGNIPPGAPLLVDVDEIYLLEDKPIQELASIESSPEKHMGNVIQIEIQFQKKTIGDDY